MLDYAETVTAERVKRVIDGYGEGDKAVAGLFGGSDALVRLSEADLMEGFTLAAKAADIDFNPGLTGAMKIDIAEIGDVTPKCKSLSKADLNFLTSQLAGKTGAERLRNSALSA